jgi:hypothetical protein
MISMKWYLLGVLADLVQQLQALPRPWATATRISLPSRSTVAFLDALEAADAVEFDIHQRLAGVQFVGGADGRFHHAAGGAEDGAGAAGFAQRMVGLSGSILRSRSRPT